MSLVIVESPTKAKTLSRFLPETYKITATFGHIRDLPKSKFGVDVEHNFAPQYEIPKDKKEKAGELKKLMEANKDLILATDPDREGEAIAWHVLALVNKKIEGVKRIVFHEITPEAVKEALEHPRTINTQLVDAQQARRVLDRLVGYKLSPLLWRKVKRGLSAGRVQSVALRLIVDREKEIGKFKAVEYWEIEVRLEAQKGEFQAKLTQYQGKKITVSKKEEADKILSQLQNLQYEVANLVRKDLKRNPYPPFTTSTLQQTSANRYSFSAKKTMKLAQDLYEEGLITYHRTDSVTLSDTALKMSREFIGKQFGKEYLPPSSRVYKTKSKLAQEAHEAIRPTRLGETKVDFSRDHQKLYELISNRFLASQMKEAIFDQLSVDIKAGDFLFRTSGSNIKFPGFLKVYNYDTEEASKKIPDLKLGEILKMLEILPSQHFTEPPARFTEASLIKTLEEKGIGRPSTYAPILSTILDRNYIEKENRSLKPTPLGIAVSDFLVENFPKVMDIDFTAKMEDSLDQVANGEIAWEPVVKEFYEPFEEKLENVTKEAKRVKVKAEATDELCPEGHHLVVRYGRFGKFLACEKFPEHKFTKTFEEKVEASCPNCGSQVIIKRTKKGRPFYGCSNYPNCKWMSWRNPAAAENKSSEKTENEPAS